MTSKVYSDYERYENESGLEKTSKQDLDFKNFFRSLNDHYDHDKMSEDNIRRHR